MTGGRDDDLLAAAVLLGVMILFGSLAARLAVATALTRSLGPALLMVGFVPLAPLVQLVLSLPVLAFLIWLARKARRFLAPDTLDDERLIAG